MHKIAISFSPDQYELLLKTVAYAGVICGVLEDFVD